MRIREAGERSDRTAPTSSSLSLSLGVGVARREDGGDVVS